MLALKPANCALAVLLVLTVVIGPSPLLQRSALGKSPDYEELLLFRDVMRRVEKNYVKQVSDKELIEGAINGMLQSLDPHSSYLTPELFKELQVETTGEFPGLGIEITLDNGILTIISPIEDTPAFRAGLQAGDKIIKIDGESTKNITLMKAVNKMRGKPGTKVTLTIMRAGFTKFKDFTITRDVIHVPSVKDHELAKGYPYFRVVNFQETTATDLQAAIKKYGGEAGIKGLIIDLRNNPGGLLNQAFKVTNLFIDRGRLIVYTDGRKQDQRMEFRATRTGVHYKFKLAILINQGSASASEIVAGAIQDHERGLLVGTKTFGKASVQTIIPLENGGGLRLTTAYYYTPDGRNIQKKGIQPDLDLEKQVEKQQEELAKEDEKTLDRLKRRFRRQEPDLEKDVVLRKALEWLKSGVTVEQYRKDHEKKKTMPETAWYMKDEDR